MATKLPVLSAPCSQLSGRAGESIQAYGLGENPFDRPSYMMGSLEVALAEIRSSLRAEQQHREADVSRLQQEVCELREALENEQVERSEGCSVLGRNLASQDEQSKDRLHEHRTHIMGVVRHHEGTVTNHMKASDDRLSHLERDLEDERHSWRETVKGLDLRIEANSAGDNKFAQETLMSLVYQRQQLEELRAKLGQCAEDVRKLWAKTAELGDAVSKESADRDSQCAALDQARVASIVQAEAAVEEFRVAVASAMQRQRKEAVDDVAEIRTRVKRVEADVASETKERREVVQAVDARVEANEANIAKLLRLPRFAPALKSGAQT